MIPTGRQIREGRLLTAMTQADLAAAADVAFGVIVRVETTDGMPMIRRYDSAAIQGALEAAGIEFTADGGEEPSVRLRKVEP